MFRRVYCNVSMLAAFSGVFSALVFTTFRHSFPSFNKVLQRNQRSYDMDEIRSDFLATMAEQVAVSLNELGYPKPISASHLAELATSSDEALVQFSEVVSWLSSELKSHCGLEEHVNLIAASDDLPGFRTELNSFLGELRCPYPAVDYASNEDDQSPSRRLELLAYLTTELQAVRTTTKRIKREASNDSDLISPEVALESTADVLGVMRHAVGQESSVKLLSTIVDEVKSRMKNLPDSSLGTPLMTEPLTDEQWRMLEELNAQMKNDYRSRAEMLLQRLDVTVRSFSWSDRLKERKREISALYDPLREQLNIRSQVTLADLLAARNDLTFVEKAGSYNLALTKASKLHKMMLIGAGPPDRGGRPKDVLRMPQWKARVVEGGGGPARERKRNKKDKDKGKRKPWKDDEAASPSGSVSMTRRSRKKSKKSSDAEGTEIMDATELG